MSKLTDEQLQQAREAVVSKHPEGQHGDGIPMTIEVLRTAAPFLQMPLDEPTDDELRELFGDQKDRSQVVAAYVAKGVREFVRRRNAALQPKFPDPRVDTVIMAMQGRGSIQLGQDLRPIAEKIVAALDKAK